MKTPPIRWGLKTILILTLATAAYLAGRTTAEREVRSAKLYLEQYKKQRDLKSATAEFWKSVALGARSDLRGSAYQFQSDFASREGQGSVVGSGRSVSFRLDDPKIIPRYKRWKFSLPSVREEYLRNCKALGIRHAVLYDSIENVAVFNPVTADFDSSVTDLSGFLVLPGDKADFRLVPDIFIRWKPTNFFKLLSRESENELAVLEAKYCNSNGLELKELLSVQFGVEASADGLIPVVVSHNLRSDADVSQ